MNESKKLAVLIPVFNGGNLLRGTIESVINANISKHLYHILIVDNCSTDNCIENIKPLTENITIFKNSQNVGRIENWNIALRKAQELNYNYATFLFVGDVWTNGSALEKLIEHMSESASTVGFSPYRIIDENNKLKRISKRISAPKDLNIIDSNKFINTIISKGLLPFAPLQANVYKLHENNSIFFSTKNPMHSDQEFTISYIYSFPGNISIISEPFFSWKEHPNRFHQKSNLFETFLGDIDLLTESGSRCGIQIDWKSARSALLVRYSRLLFKDPKTFFRIFKHIKSTDEKFKASEVFLLLWKTLIKRRSMVDLKFHNLD